MFFGNESMVIHDPIIGLQWDFDTWCGTQDLKSLPPLLFHKSWKQQQTCFSYHFKVTFSGLKWLPFGWSKGHLEEAGGTISNRSVRSFLVRSSKLQFTIWLWDVMITIKFCHPIMEPQTAQLFGTERILLEHIWRQTQKQHLGERNMICWQNM